MDIPDATSNDPTLHYDEPTGVVYNQEWDATMPTFSSNGSHIPIDPTLHYDEPTGVVYNQEWDATMPTFSSNGSHIPIDPTLHYDEPTGVVYNQEWDATMPTFSSNGSHIPIDPTLHYDEPTGVVYNQEWDATMPTFSSNGGHIPMHCQESNTTMTTCSNNSYSKAAARRQNAPPFTTKVIFKVINIGYDMRNMMPLISGLHASQISKTPIKDHADDELFHRVFVDEKEDCFLFLSGSEVLRVPKNELRRDCISVLEKSLKASCHFILPILWNEGDLIHKRKAISYNTSTILSLLGLLNMQVGEVRNVHNFTIRKVTAQNIYFLFGERILTIETTTQQATYPCKIRLTDSSGNHIENAFDLNYSQSIMLFAVKNHFLLDFKCGAWKLRQKYLQEKKIDIIISDALSLSSIRMISNIYNYSIDDIRDLYIDCFDLPSMERYQTGCFVIKEAVSKLANAVISTFPRIGGAFIGLYEHMSEGKDNFLTSYEISLYQTLGKILYISLCHGIAIKQLSAALVSGLLMFHIDEIIYPNAILSTSHRKTLCRRFFEVHKYGVFKYRGIDAILSNQVDMFHRLPNRDLMKMVGAFFISSKWWNSMELEKEMASVDKLKYILVSQCWHSMQESIMEAIDREYDVFINPIYTITRSLASLVFADENISEDCNVVKYKNTLKRLDNKLSCLPFPIENFCEERVKLQSIFSEKVPVPFSVTPLGCVTEKNVDSVAAIKTRWINKATAENMKLSYDLWSFTSPTVPYDLKPITLHTTYEDIGRMLYIAPCENRIYTSPKFYIFDHDLQEWHSFALTASNTAKAEQDFIQSVKDSILWSSGYPTKNKMMGNTFDNLFCQVKE